MDDERWKCGYNVSIDGILKSNPVIWSVDHQWLITREFEI